MNATNNASNDSRLVWFITGSSRGLGAALTEAALSRGDAVVATARDAKAVRERFGDRPGLLAANLDVTDEASIEAAVAAAVASFGRVDVLVNNAGFGLVGAVEEATGAEVRRLYETNVFGLLAVSRAVLPHLRRQRSGHVFNLSSVGGFVSGPGYGVYCSTKFAVEALSEAMHAELAPLGVRVTVVEPGYFRTDFLDDRSVVHSAPSLPDYAATAGETRQTARARNHQQPGDPAKLAAVLVDLARDPRAPLRLPLGTDAVAAIEAKQAFVKAELDTWRGVSVSTDFAAAPERAAENGGVA